MYYGEQVSLRALEMSDLDEVMKYQNEWSIRRWAGVPLPKSRRSVEKWLEEATVSDPWKDGTLSFAVVDKRSGEFLGITRFYGIKNPHHRASVGLGILDPKNRSKGYGTDTTNVMLWIAFNILALHSVYLDTMEHNERAIHVAEKSGFKKIGVFRETEFINGEYKGLVYLDILKDEFFERFPPGVPIGQP